MTNTRFQTFLDKVARTILYHSPFRPFALYKYRYAFSPAQYCWLIALLDEALQVEGHIIEVGCYRGYTTVFLNKHLDEVAPERTYYAVDTFSGFTKDAVKHEIKKRDKKRDKKAFKKFTVNSVEWFKQTLRLNHILRVEAIDAKAEALNALLPLTDPVCFALVDVDLYLPTLKSLNALKKRMASGGIIIVDDCQENHAYDGSRQALEEFCAEHNLHYEIVAGKLGVIRFA